MPTLENVMYNYIKCSSLLFGSRVRYGIGFKANQPGFDIFTRTCYHNFKVCINIGDFEGAVGCQLSTIGAYAMAESTNIGIYD